jgi:hypothetical protein
MDCQGSAARHRWAMGIDIGLMLAISDIDIFYSDIGRKYFGLKPSFRYRKSSDIDIRVHCDIRYQLKYLFLPPGLEPKTLILTGERIAPQLLCWSMNSGMSDIGYRIKVYSDIRCNVRLRSLQLHIGSSDIQLSPISLITDIWLSAHLCC